MAKRSSRPSAIFGALAVALILVIAAGLYGLAPRQPPALLTAQPAGATPAAKPMPSYVPERSGYYDTVWPSEHADLWRSHAALNAGLPASFDPAQLRVATAPLNLPVWGYTRQPDEVFVIGGSPFVLNTFTQAIKTGQSQRDLVSTVRDMASGDQPYVAKLNPLTMQTKIVALNRGFTANYTRGLVIHQNGYVYAVAQSVLYKLNPDTMHIEASMGLPLVGQLWPTQYWTTYNGLQVLASGELVVKGFDLLDSVNVPGYLLLVDPETLAIDVQQTVAVSSARLMLQQKPDGTAFLYHVNALDSLRYTVSLAGFQLDPTWTRRYRSAEAGSTQASSPLLFGKLGQVVFADNTAPGATTPLQLYTQPVDASALPAVLTGVAAFSKSLPSFNFFMVAADPYQQQLLVYYDPMHNLLSAHRVSADGRLDPVWERDGYKISASPALVPDRDLLYIDDYRAGKDHLVVLKLSTGQELAAVELSATLPTIGTIVPGMNNDVYLTSSEAGARNGLISRIYVP